MISGSEIHNDFQQFQDRFNPLFQHLTQLNQQINNRRDIQKNDTLMIEYGKQFGKIKTAIDDFVVNKKSSPVGPFLLVVTSELEQDIATLERRFNLLDEKMKTGFYGKILKQQIDDSRIGAVGTDAITFTQTDTAGVPVSLTSFRGKYVLVDFWASWCKPCRMENPNVVAAYNKFNSKNFTILGVSLDRSKEPWIQAIKDDNLGWTHVSDLKYWNNEAALKYKIQSIPKNYLIDPKGKIIAKDLRGPDLEMKLCELLGCK